MHDYISFQVLTHKLIATSGTPGEGYLRRENLGLLFRQFSSESESISNIEKFSYQNESV